MDVLILGGTSLARALAVLLDGCGMDVTVSLAGRTRAPRPLPVVVREGGFGGAAGLADWLRQNRPRCVVNAVHSFAATMTGHAVEACLATGTPQARLEPPSWHQLPCSGDWLWVAGHAEAVQTLRDLPGPVLLTIGRQATSHYLALGPRDITHRVIDAPAQRLPAGWRLLNRRGPYTLQGERALMDAPGHRIATLVTKDSGGAEPDPKLVVAEEIGATVVVIERPSPPVGTPHFDTAERAAEWVRATVGRPIAWQP